MSRVLLAYPVRLPIAREGWAYILAPLGLSGALWVGGWSVAAGASLILAALVTWFFRDPPRLAPQGDGLILAPADGTVLSVGPSAETDLDGGAIQVSIFLSILDVHVNRAPSATVVERIDYRPGRFRLAWRHEASEGNEQNVIVLRAAEGRLVVKQIAGFLARRIVCGVTQGQRLEAGDRIGIIRFGSRVDLVVGGSAKIWVKPGDRVKGGVTVVGALR
jgi:phosphatidylserine decarboxylase